MITTYKGCRSIGPDPVDPLKFKKVVLATIPCTGTQFWLKLLIDEGIEVKRFHTTDKQMPDILEYKDDPDYLFVTTYRDMNKLIYTWDTVSIPFDRDQCIRNWYRLMAFHPICVSVDTDKEASLQVLSSALGIEIKTDWAPVNARSGQPL
jgi:hypothetical protein